MFFQMFYQDEWETECCIIATKCLGFAQTKQHVWLQWMATTDRTGFSMPMKAISAPFEVEKLTIHWFLTKFHRYFECFFGFVASNYV